MLGRMPGREEIEAALEHYQEHGWAHLPAVADPDFLARLQRRSEEIATGTVVYSELFFQADAESGRYEDLGYGDGWEGAGRNYRKIEKLEVDPLFRGWLSNALFERIARRLYEGSIRIYRAVLFSKAPFVGSETPWHQDGGRIWGLNQNPRLQIWTALDDARPESGCLEVYDRSHHGGLASPLGGVVPEKRAAEAEALALPARAGDVILVHNLLWHRSGPNRSGQPRRALTVCYLDGNTHCVRTRKTPRSFPLVFP